MIVRQATRADAATIAAVHRAAFGNDAEARLVAELGAEGDVALSLVAADDDAVVGHVLFSRMRVTADGAPLVAVALAPVAVLPRLQRQGIGSRMIHSGLAAIAQSGENLCFVLGDVAYYRRFGFAVATAGPFASPYAGDHFMARWCGAPLSPRVGTAVHAPAFARLDQ